MKCCIVQDLLPGYIDGLTSEGTNEEVRKHLKDCETCRTLHEQMSAEIPKKMLLEKKEIDFLGKLKTRIRQGYAFGAFLICALVTCVVGFMRAYDLPVAYDPQKMTIEINNMDELCLVLQESVDSDDFTSRGRTLQQNGEPVRVVYYCYTRTLWNSLFPTNGCFMDSCISTGTIYENSLFRDSGADDQPKMRNIYYLPMGNMNRLDRLSDEEFDAQKENAVLVWSGVI